MGPRFLSPDRAQEAALRLDPRFERWRLVLPDERTHVLRIRRAWRWRERLQGLLGTSGLDRDVGLWLAPCASVHSVGMRYAIDVLFLDALDRVIGIRPALRPGRFAGYRGARSIVEMAAAEAARLAIVPGARFQACIDGGVEHSKNGERP